MSRERRSLSLDLARGWYAIVGGGGLLLTAGIRRSRSAEHER